MPTAAALLVAALLLGACDWSQFRFGPDGTGFNPYESTIGRSNVSGLQRRWSEASGIPAIESSPIVANGVVYASTSAGRLDAFDAATGTAKWSFSKSAPNVFGSVVTGLWVPAPAVANGLVYDTGGDGTLYAIDASSGTKLWSTTTGFPYPSSVTIADGKVYVASAVRSLFVFNATTGAKLWSQNPGIGGTFTTMVPTVANGVVYTTSDTSANQLVARNATTGAVLWTAATTPFGVSTAAVGNGVVFVSSGVVLDTAFNAKTGAKLWSAGTGNCCSPPTSPAVANGVVYASNDTHLVAAFSATTGAALWSTDTGGPTGGIGPSAPVVANGVTYVGIDGPAVGDGKVEALNANTGVPLWSVPANGTQVLPIIDTGVVYATSNDESDGGAQVGHLDAYSLPVHAAGLTMSPTFAPDFGIVPVGSSSAPTNFTVTNFGATTTTAISDSLSGADRSQFNIVSDTCAGSTLAGGASCAIAVRFAPTVLGARTATLAVHATTGGTTSAIVSGGRALTIKPASMNYGTEVDGTSSLPKTFTVTNQGPNPVSPIIGSLAASRFTMTSDNCTGKTLLVGAMCDIAATFTPDGANLVEPFNTALSVSSRPGVADATANLSGTGTPVALAPAIEHYGTVAVGSGARATFTIRNVTSTALVLPLAPSGVTGSGFSITSDGCNGTTLAGGATCNVVVTFTPSVMGKTYRGQLTVSSAFFRGLMVWNQAELIGTGG
jgi:outer membrane protein assembly factor BamB